MFTPYVLYSSKFDKIYVGQTSDLSRRIVQHNLGKHRYTKRYVPWKILYTEKFKTRAEAMKREKELKSHQGRNFIRSELLNGGVRQSPD